MKVTDFAEGFSDSEMHCSITGNVGRDFTHNRLSVRLGVGPWDVYAAKRVDENNVPEILLKAMASHLLDLCVRHIAYLEAALEKQCQD